jgi:hypothetical protein
LRELPYQGVLTSSTADNENLHGIAFRLKSYFGEHSNGFLARPQAKATFSSAHLELQSRFSPIGDDEEFVEPRTTLEKRFNIR